MAEARKILTSEFGKEYNGPNGTVYYHNVTFVEGEKPWNIGSKEKNPAFLAAGQTLHFEVKDAAKRSLKRVTPPETPVTASNGQYTPQKSSKGFAIGNALTNAVLLIAHGKVELKDLKATAKRIIDIGAELETE